MKKNAHKIVNKVNTSQISWISKDSCESVGIKNKNCEKSQF